MVTISDGYQPATSQRHSSTGAGSAQTSLTIRWLLQAVVFSYSLFVYFVFAARGAVEGWILKRPAKLFWTDLQSERLRQYDLQEVHPCGLKHAFISVAGGIKLHYLTNAGLANDSSAIEWVELLKMNRFLGGRGRSANIKAKNLVICFHGWPDTAALWSFVIKQLPRSALLDTVIICVDLPGFAGSDSLESYGPDNVLTTLTHFCIAMRDRHLDESLSGKVINLAFDWGGVINFRLAAQAPEIADHFVICNAPLPRTVSKSVDNRRRTCRRMLGAWWTVGPHTFDGLLSAFSPLVPVLSQLHRSNYVFTFNLPWILARQTVLRCNLWLLRLAHSIAFGHSSLTSTPELAAELASYLGPFDPDVDGHSDCSFSKTVRDRGLTGDNVTEPLKYYRDGLVSKRWNQSPSLKIELARLTEQNRVVRGRRELEASQADNVDRPPGALGTPATVIWGERDTALDHRLALDNLESYLTPRSQIVRIPNVGHWTPKEGEGPAVVAAALAWALRTGAETSSSAVKDDDSLARAVAIVSASAGVTMLN